MGRLTKIYRDKKDDPYRKLLEQLTREDELEGCVLVTIKKEGDTVTIELRDALKKLEPLPEKTREHDPVKKDRWWYEYTITDPQMKELARRFKGGAK